MTISNFMTKFSASYTGVLPTAPYANARPGYTAEVEFECDPHEYGNETLLAFISGKQKELQEICYTNFKGDESKAIVERINRERLEFRFYYMKDGSPVPSVTSILGVDKDWFVEAEKLRILASESNVRHGLVREYIKTGKMPLEPSSVDGIEFDYMLSKKAGIEVNGMGFLNFIEAYPLTNMQNGEPVISEEHRYGGTPDFWCVPKANEKEEIKAESTCCDVKRTPDVHENMMQIAAYIKASGKECKQMLVIPINDKTKQGFSKPIVSSAVDKYFGMFLKKRADFKKRYGI